MQEQKLTKMTVTCNELHCRTGIHAKGHVIEATDEERAELLKDQNAVDAPEDAVVSQGIAKVIDPIEKDIIERNFEAARESGKMRAPAGADQLDTPTPGPGPAPRESNDIAPIPGTSSE